MTLLEKILVRLRPHQSLVAWGMLSLFWLLSSCKANRALADTGEIRRIPTRQILRSYRGVPDNMKTLSGKVKVVYREGGKEQSTTLSFRMYRDSVIWLRAPLGMATALVTREEIKFYNRLENTFFDGDFDYLREIAGVDLNFELLEAILLGESMLNLNDGRFRSDLEGGEYALLPKDRFQGFDVAIFLNPSSFRVSRQYIADPFTADSLRIYYQYGSGGGLPDGLKAEVDFNRKAREITLEYRNLEKNKSLRFPYRVPRGFKQIEIKP